MQTTAESWRTEIKPTPTLLTALLLAPLSPLPAQTAGPLRVCPDNPRCFADNSGKATLLTGAHT